MTISTFVRPPMPGFGEFVKIRTPCVTVKAGHSFTERCIVNRKFSSLVRLRHVPSLPPLTPPPPPNLSPFMGGEGVWQGYPVPIPFLAFPLSG